MVTKFERERYFVEALAKILPLSVDQYRDPFDDYARETGVDVIAVVGSRQIGFQVRLNGFGTLWISRCSDRP